MDPNSDFSMDWVRPSPTRKELLQEVERLREEVKRLKARMLEFENAAHQ
jgi:hypothetical protein